MNRLDRYIISHILGLTAIVALALLAIHSFVTFVSQVDEIGTGEFGYRELPKGCLLRIVPRGPEQ